MARALLRLQFFFFIQKLLESDEHIVVSERWTDKVSWNSIRTLILSTPRGGLHVFISNAFEQGGADLREGGLFNLVKMMVSVEYKVEKHKYKKAGGHAAEDGKQIQTSCW